MPLLYKTVPPSKYNEFINTDKGGLSDFLAPVTENGAIDIVEKFPWTLTPRDGRKETPYIVLTEFRLLTSAFINSAKYYATGTAQQATGNANVNIPTMRGYQGLFDYKHSTGFWYKLPYFNEVGNEVQSSWTSLDAVQKVQDAIGSVSGNAADLIGGAVKAVAAAYSANFPRVGVMDRPKLWEQSTPRSINIKFPLYNTQNFNDIKKNWEFCYLLLYQNMFNKRDFVTAIPPVFYTAFVPGQFFTIAAYVSDLKIYNRGNIRRLNLGTGNEKDFKNIPDVFEIDMTLTDMVMPSQNMLKSILDGTSPVTVQNINE
jgi:hypothetical protein